MNPNLQAKKIIEEIARLKRAGNVGAVQFALPHYQHFTVFEEVLKQYPDAHFVSESKGMNLYNVPLRIKQTPNGFNFKAKV